MRRSLAAHTDNTIPSADTNNAGFTLIEVSGALAVVAVALTSIGALMAINVRASRSVESRLARFEIARSTMTALPSRHQLRLGHFSGQTLGHDWRVEVTPYPINAPRQLGRAFWTPQIVTVTVRSPTGVPVQISTVRLRRSSGG